MFYRLIEKSTKQGAFAYCYDNLSEEQCYSLFKPFDKHLECIWLEEYEEDESITYWFTEQGYRFFYEDIQHLVLCLESLNISVDIINKETINNIIYEDEFQIITII